MSSAATGAVRRLLVSGARSFRSTTAKAGGGAHGNEPEYLHAPHMYSLDKMPNRKLKMAILVFGGMATGFGVPIAAVYYQLHK
eukprot:jgi/Chlat1/2293/Chrsp17S02585